MELIEKMRELAQSVLTDESHFIVDVIFSGKQGPSKKMLVIVDGDKGVTIDDCTSVSRQLSAILDETNLIEEHYLLEVSTPGLDHPLKLKRQFKKNVGRSLKVHMQDKNILQGKMTAADEDKITIDQEVKEGKKIEIKPREIPYSDMEKAFVLVSFK
ncbi:MAG TPA: ribosome maturation factor RimP [Cyclobacteriaceae bacterium]